jgi:hypothetical protein
MKGMINSRAEIIITEPIRVAVSPPLIKGDKGGFFAVTPRQEKILPTPPLIKEGAKRRYEI